MKDRLKSYEKKQKKKKSHKSDKKSRHKSERKSKKDKIEKKREKELKKRLKVEKRTTLQKLSEKSEAEVVAVIKESNHVDDYCGPSIDLMNRAKCPETKEQWEHRQSQIRRVVDPETGRIRLIKGDGEILEEIVPRERHKQINREATKNDGQTFQKNTVGATVSRYK